MCCCDKNLLGADGLAGTWTPTLSSSRASVLSTLSSSTGTYSVDGNVVSCSFQFQVGAYDGGYNVARQAFVSLPVATTNKSVQSATVFQYDGGTVTANGTITLPNNFKFSFGAAWIDLGGIGGIFAGEHLVFCLFPQTSTYNIGDIYQANFTYQI